MPQPRFSDIKRFCQLDGWQEKKGSSGSRGDHYRYRKTLADGRILRTKVSHGDDQIQDASLWRHIWRDQLALESEDQFWEVLESGQPVDRTPTEPAPSGPSLPGWLVDNLIRKVGLTPEEVAQLSDQEAHDRLNDFYSRQQE